MSCLGVLRSAFTLGDGTMKKVCIAQKCVVCDRFLRVGELEQERVQDFGIVDSTTTATGLVGKVSSIFRSFKKVLGDNDHNNDNDNINLKNENENDDDSDERSIDECKPNQHNNNNDNNNANDNYNVVIRSESFARRQSAHVCHAKHNIMSRVDPLDVAWLPAPYRFFAYSLFDDYNARQRHVVGMYLPIEVGQHAQFPHPTEPDIHIPKYQLWPLRSFDLLGLNAKYFRDKFLDEYTNVLALQSLKTIRHRTPKIVYQNVKSIQYVLGSSL